MEGFHLRLYTNYPSKTACSPAYTALCALQMEKLQPGLRAGFRLSWNILAYPSKLKVTSLVKTGSAGSAEKAGDEAQRMAC